MMRKTDSIAVILLAAGSSSRMGTGVKKEYLPLGNGTVLSQSLIPFIEAADSLQKKISAVIVTCPSGQEELCKKALFADSHLAERFASLPLNFIAGGKSRQKSVFVSLEKAASLASEESIVLIHDAARPYAGVDLVSRVILEAEKAGAAVPVIPPVDTQKEISENIISRHLDRSTLGAVQTPQAFELGPILLCHKEADKKEHEYTDDSEIWDSFPQFTEGRKVHVVKGETENKKITFQKDIPQSGGTITRIGMGTDLHRLVEGRPFILGGITIPAEKGEDGHSDGDVLLHAITDALLGAAAMGDIGSYFPPEDAKWKDAKSTELLSTVWSEIQSKGWSLENLDCVVEFERPKFLPWREQVIDSIANVLNTGRERIFVKAKTNEKQDSVGQGNAIKSYAVCLLTKSL